MDGAGGLGLGGQEGDAECCGEVAAAVLAMVRLRIWVSLFFGPGAPSWAPVSVQDMYVLFDSMWAVTEQGHSEQCGMYR